MSTNTGGPAFPAYEFVQGYGQMMAVGGMTLRDYFAAKAMQVLINGKDVYAAASAAYVMADAMLKERTL
jgi:hypothetical protein